MARMQDICSDFDLSTFEGRKAWTQWWVDRHPDIPWGQSPPIGLPNGATLVHGCSHDHCVIVENHTFRCQECGRVASVRTGYLRRLPGDATVEYRRRGPDPKFCGRCLGTYDLPEDMPVIVTDGTGRFGVYGGPTGLSYLNFPATTERDGEKP